MTLTVAHIDPPVEDSVSNVLKWVLLLVAIATFGLLAWATVETYRAAPHSGQHPARRPRDARGRRGVLYLQGRLAQPSRHQGQVKK